MPTTYPYWDSDNRYIVAGATGAPTIFARIYQLPNSWWQVRCFGNRSDCPEKLGPFFGPIANAQAAIQNHCQVVHYVTPPGSGPPVGPTAPEILSIAPQFGKLSVAFTLTIHGQNFAATSLIYFDGASQPGTVYSSPTQLSCPIAATQISSARSYSCQVIDSVTGSSNVVYFTATATSAVFLSSSLPAIRARTTTSSDPTTPSKIIPRF